MKPLHAATTELAASRVFAPHGVPSAASCARNCSVLTFRQRKLHHSLIAPVALLSEHFGTSRAPRAGGSSGASHRRPRRAVSQSAMPENRVDAPFLTDAADLISGVETFVFDCDGESVSCTSNLFGSSAALLFLCAFIHLRFSRRRLCVCEKFNSFRLFLSDCVRLSGRLAVCVWLGLVMLPSAKIVS